MSTPLSVRRARQAYRKKTTLPVKMNPMTRVGAVPQRQQKRLHMRKCQKEEVSKSKRDENWSEDSKDQEESVLSKRIVSRREVAFRALLKIIFRNIEANLDLLDSAEELLDRMTEMQSSPSISLDSSEDESAENCESLHSRESSMVTFDPVSRMSLDGSSDEDPVLFSVQTPDGTFQYDTSETLDSLIRSLCIKLALEPEDFYLTSVGGFPVHELGTNIVLHRILPGGMPKKKKQKAGHKRKARTMNEARVPRIRTLRFDREVIVHVTENYSGRFTNNAAADASIFIPLTAVGSAAALGGASIGPTQYENQPFQLYDRYRVVRADVRIKMNNNEGASQVTLFSAPTNQIPTNNTSTNYNLGFSLKGRNRLVLEHTTGIGANATFFTHVNCALFYNDVGTYLHDDNTAAATNPTTGPPPVPSVPTNNIFFIFGGRTISGTFTAAGGIIFEIQCRKTVRLFEFHNQPS